MVVTVPRIFTVRSGQRIADLLNRLPEIWRNESSFQKDTCAILCILAISLAAAFAGAVPTRIFGHDIFVVVNGAWRVLNGQRPILDFSPGIGLVSFLVAAAGLKLAHNSIDGIGYATALVAGISGLWAYLLGRWRMAWIPAVLVSAVLSLIAAAPFPLGLLPNQLSHAMSYNRYGYALLGVLALESFLPLRPPRDARALFSGVSAGVISIILLFLKPSFGLVALVFIGSSILLGARNRFRLLGIAAGLAFAAIAVMAYLRFDIAAVWADFQLLAGARGGSLTVWAVRWALTKGLADFLWLALLALMVSLIRGYEQPALRAFEPLVSAFIVVAGQALLLATNAQPSGYPLNAVLAIMLVEQGRVAAAETSVNVESSFLKIATIIALIGLLCYVPAFAANAGGLADAVVQRLDRPSHVDVPLFTEPNLANLLLYDMPYGTEADRRSNGRVYVQYVNDGVNLIRGVSRADETVTTLDMMDPFSYALLRSPARGGSACMDFNSQFNDQHKPSPEWLLTADIVMVPKHPSASEPTVQALARNYSKRLEAEYRLCAQDAWWELYKHPANLAGCPVAH